MSATRAPRRGSRIIVAVGPTASDPLALAAAARLARSAGAELAALFVEDTNLLRLAELPFAFEIGSASGKSRKLSSMDVEHAFKRQEDDLRRALLETAAMLQLDLSFDIVRGRPINALLEAAASEDLVVLANCAVRSLARSSPPNVMREALRDAAPRTPRAKRQRVTAVLQSAASAPGVLTAAHNLAIVSAAELQILVAEPMGAAAALGDLIDDWLKKNRQISARIDPLAELTTENIARLISDQDTAAVFWSGDEQAEIVSECELLVATMTCPLIVVR